MVPSEINRVDHLAPRVSSPILGVLLSDQGLVVLGLIALALAAWLVHGRQADLDRARAAAGAGRWDQAARLAKRALERRPDDPEARLLYARAALERTPRQLATALKWARSVPHEGRWAAPAWEIEGMALWGLRRAAAAEAVWTQWMNADPRATLPCWHLSRAYEMQERPAEARALGLEYTRRSPDKTSGLIELLRQATERPEPSYVIGMWQACVEQDPEDYYSRRALGLCHVLDNEMDQGMPLLEWCRRRQPANLDGSDALIWAHLEQADFAAARALLDRLPPQADRDARFWEHRARVAAHQRRWDRVVECYTRALAVNPFDPRAHFRRITAYELGQALQRLGRERAAAPWLDQARKLNVVWASVGQVYDPLSKTSDPSLEQCHRAALFCDLVGLLPEARGWYEEVLRRQPQHPGSRAAVARLLRLELNFQDLESAVSWRAAAGPATHQ